MKTGLLLLFTIGIATPAPNDAPALREEPRTMERLKRGLVAVSMGGDGIYLGWRLLRTDPDAVSFDVYRDRERVNDKPIFDSTNFIDPEGTPASRYSVRPVGGGQVVAACVEVAPQEHPYFDMPLNPPRPFVLRDGEKPPYRPGDASVGDLDGNGEFELVLKWVGRAKDNSQDGYTSPTILEGIEMDGTSLWRIHLGINVRSGPHYTQFMVYDLDADGLAEVVCRTSDGTVDGVGKILGESSADHRDQRGRVLRAPERLTIFNGRTGAAMETVSFAPARGDIRVWGDTYGNRSERFLACIAYLDGKSPSVVMGRGYYRGRTGPGRTALAAWDWRAGHLTKRWQFDTLNRNDLIEYIGQGCHSIAAGDVDNDGKDEILYGAMAVDDDGSPLYTTKLGHGDAHHFSDLDPSRPGLEFFMPHESAVPGSVFGMSFRDARTGEILWGIPVAKRRDIGRGGCANIFAGTPGAEAWGVDENLYSCFGKVVGPAPKTPANFFVWWDGDATREILNENWIAKYDPNTEGAMRRLLTAEGCTSINSTKATPILSADILGDWREEVIWPTEDGSSLRLYTTITPTSHRVPTLMHDPIYRLSIAWQNVAYNQPPHLGYCLESLVKQSNTY